MTYPAAQGNIEKLVSHGILHQMGEATYGKLYIAEDIFEVLAARDDAR